MSGDDGYYWCLRHGRVESGDNVCAARHRLGPFGTPAEAERALERARERNQAWDEEDARWEWEAR
ncbi:MAG: hypothetical protein ACRDT2_09800 [Natronosporangium sp.]